MKHAVSLLSALALILPAAAHAGGESITIPKKVAFKNVSNVPDAVQRECDLEFKTSDAIGEALKDAGYQVTQADKVSKASKGKVLELNITGIFAHGGPFAPKKLDVDGTLYDNGKSIGSFHDVRNTSHGRGVCGMLERDAKEIASDIAKWMKAPQPDTRLGDAK